MSKIKQISVYNGQQQGWSAPYDIGAEASNVTFSPSSDRQGENVQTALSNVFSNLNDLNGLSTVVDGLTESVQQLNSSVSTQISDLNTSISDLNTSISNLNTSVDNLQQQNKLYRKDFNVDLSSPPSYVHVTPVTSSSISFLANSTVFGCQFPAGHFSLTDTQHASYKPIAITRIHTNNFALVHRWEVNPDGSGYIVVRSWASSPGNLNFNILYSNQPYEVY